MKKVPEEKEMKGCYVKYFVHYNSVKIVFHHLHWSSLEAIMFLITIFKIVFANIYVLNLLLKTNAMNNNKIVKDGAGETSRSEQQGRGAH